MKISSLSVYVLFLTVFTACSSSTYKPRKRVNHAGHETPWNREKIEQNKRYEEASKPTVNQMKQWKTEASNCTVMSATQMKRSSASGCRPLDPAEGHGDNMYCCDPAE